ncbi:carbon monoxide dehydrogenase 1 [Clostridium pasteurianum DSM 525 = ATCC 6013]|uniref:Carbon monoxide dehydrogenase n=1 Tax=Clostridium pasteurianum DSM 525 = ATCC 6013 TaxID=1262449 RepID=A0A0H3J660_CLOPA|nr:carbon monoxide dehydrogenase 1 [Clostridium pasteurianum DSM 525 = ATCC 6013]AOZ80461.1 carbon monoxide dehydrogenase [Clostridium pasteurianum]AJA53489.1 carbon monoxide dehydrogenase 1 [Clostridium pasteurianum DSM 525 = ATCC 6013]AOZ76664.1 carbon monoxide dehydrogenase [Clostridium pasteurianum DSM 525 = ATCC 6013]ELP58979.1 carbon-monoxide dehydrogenase, catalytic subunit [Clostridium pasteurianum DSM 525 = ATCC 6013]
MIRKKFYDKVTQEGIKKAHSDGVETIWDRLEAQQPQCGFGQLGLCCRNCNMGPCRIDPFGEGPSKGVCGATAATIVSRNLVRMIAAGAASHSDHGREIALAFKEIAEGELQRYEIKDQAKLKQVASKLEVDTNREIKQIAEDVAKIALLDFGKQDEKILAFANAYAPESLKKLWKSINVAPRNIDREVTESMHRTHMGVDADHFNLSLQGIRTALSDGWGGSLIGSEFSDVMFGTPQPVQSYANLGVLEEDKVNVITHGHLPILSEKIVEAAEDEEMIELAKSKGAAGIVVAGMCCTGNEITMRHGIPTAGNFLQQELAIVTGALDAMVVDYQCIMPSLVDVADCYHTKIITTSEKAKIPGAEHIEFYPQQADEIARKIIKRAIENYPARAKDKIKIPSEKMDGIVGFSVEAIVEALGGSLNPLIEAIKKGTIKGIAGIVGCNNPKIEQDKSHIEVAKELIANDILVVGTGCWSIAAMKAGLFKLEGAELAGESLKTICRQLGIPPCLHMGSCVDNARILAVISAIAETLGVKTSDLPVAGAAPEWMSEKAVAIGTYFVASGIFTVLGNTPPILGSVEVVKLLTKDIEKVIGGKFAVESNPHKIAELMLRHIQIKREQLLGKRG